MTRQKKEIKEKKELMTLCGFEVMQYFDYFNHDYDWLKNTAKSFAHTYNAKIGLIIHNRDIKDDGSPKGIHFHLMCYGMNQSRPIESIAKYFDVEPNFVNKIKSYKSAFRYLVHLDNPDKAQYSTNEITFINCGIQDFDYTKHEQKPIIDFDLHSLAYYQRLYLYNAKELRDLEKEYSVYLNLKAIDNLSYNREVMFITGASGLGKTTLAKHFASKYFSNDEIFISSSSNDALNGYIGQKCIIFDDIRGSSFSLTDLIKLLDNNTNSSVKSRYNNKQLCRCELIILTSSIPLNKFYTSENIGSESLTQLYRRVKHYYQIKLTNDITNNERIILEQYEYSFDFNFDEMAFPYSLYQTSDITSLTRSFKDVSVESRFDFKNVL